MPKCDYCGDAFDDEASYLDHLRAEHDDQLGAIDRRRVEAGSDTDDAGLPTGPIVLGLVFGVAVLLVGYVVFVGGSGGGSAATVNGIQVAQTPGAVSEDTHEHGRIEVTINGERVDFGRAEYQRPREFGAFHFEGGDGRVWHKHAEGVTLEYAMATLGIEVTADSVTVDGETYRDADDGTTVSVTVDGDPVDPAEYELQGTAAATGESGDFVRIVVTTDG